MSLCFVRGNTMNFFIFERKIKDFSMTLVVKLIVIKNSNILENLAYNI